MANKLILSLLLLSLQAPFHAQQPGEETIRWTAGKKLTWADYKGTPDPSSDAAASTTTYLGIEYNIDGNEVGFKISSSFSTGRSWGRHKTDHVLSHEQGHFDIAEIFARKLYKEMQAYKFNSKTYKTDLRKIYQGVLDEKDKMQTLYDVETNHSINKEKQAAWEITIARELVKLEEYAGYGK